MSLTCGEVNWQHAIVVANASGSRIQMNKSKYDIVGSPTQPQCALLERSTSEAKEEKMKAGCMKLFEGTGKHIRK